MEKDCCAVFLLYILEPERRISGRKSIELFQLPAFLMPLPSEENTAQSGREHNEKDSEIPDKTLDKADFRWTLSEQVINCHEVQGNKDKRGIAHADNGRHLFYSRIRMTEQPRGKRIAGKNEKRRGKKERPKCQVGTVFLELRPPSLDTREAFNRVGLLA